MIKLINLVVLVSRSYANSNYIYLIKHIWNYVDKATKEEAGIIDSTIVVLIMMNFKISVVAVNLKLCVV